MVDKSHLQQLTLQCHRVLMDKPQHKILVKEFEQLYAQYYLKPCNIDELMQNLSKVVQVNYNLVSTRKYFYKKSCKTM